MDNKGKYEFIAKEASAALEKHNRLIKNQNRKNMNEIIKSKDYQKYIKAMTDAVKESIQAMNEWESTKYDQLGGLTAGEYISGIDSPDEIIAVTAAFIKENKGMLPPCLTQKLKGPKDNLTDKVSEYINSMRQDENGKLPVLQQAVLVIAKEIASEKLADPLSRLLFRLDESRIDDSSIMLVMDVLKKIGKPSIPCLIAASEKSGHTGRIYGSSITTLAEIASPDKTEEIYMYLKECFRKSSQKADGAMALGLYGDGRAVAAIRSYVERNISKIPKQDYFMYRDIIIKLGGIVSDLDKQYASML